MKDYSPTFILGTPRSGTTLTAKILNRHSRIFMPGETHFFDDIYARRKQIGDLKDDANREIAVTRLLTIYNRYAEPDDQERIDTIFSKTDPNVVFNSFCDTYKDLFKRFMDIQMAFEQKHRWGNNVPRDIFNIKYILDSFPNAKFIICIRDPRDFLASYKNYGKVAIKSHKKRIKNLYHPFVTSAIWKGTTNQIGRIKHNLPQDKFIIIRYEDLASNPESTLKGICEHIGEKFESHMLELTASNSSYRENRKKTSGIYKSSIGRWRDILSDEEAYIAEKLAGPRLKEYRYPIAQLKVNFFKLAYTLLSTPYGVWKAINVNREHMGPLYSHIAKRIISIYR
jgi:hypothetical protein